MGIFTDQLMMMKQQQPSNEWWSILLSYPHWATLEQQFTVQMKPFMDPDIDPASYTWTRKECIVPFYPPKESIFRCFQECPYDRTKVILIGQDPYIHEGEAMGLCFSVPSTIKTVPPSLKNIFKEMQTDLHLMNPRVNPDLTDWAHQGILMLNASLTVLEGKSNSHKQIWQPFMQWFYGQCISQLPIERPLLLVMWGKDAQQWKPYVFSSKKENIVTIESAHPSPLSATRGFFGSKPFSKIQGWWTAHYPSELMIQFY
jgi:uracil-DNA glycosylase